MNALRLTLLAVAMLRIIVWPAYGQEGDFRLVTQQTLNGPDPADWLRWRRTYDGWGYSPLDQIDRNDVSRLQLVWSYAFDPASQGLQAEPLAYDGRLVDISAGRKPGSSTPPLDRPIEIYGKVVASPMPASWNQITTWLDRIDELRRVV